MFTRALGEFENGIECGIFQLSMRNYSLSGLEMYVHASMVFIQQITAEKRAFAWYLRTCSKFSYGRIPDKCGMS